jgi:hypothetical protein
VEAALECLLSYAAHVIRLARPFQPMHNNEHWHVALLASLPMTLRQQLRIVFDMEKPLLWRRQRKPSRPVRRRNSHGMPVSQQRMRLKGWEFWVHSKTLFQPHRPDKERCTLLCRSLDRNCHSPYN